MQTKRVVITGIGTINPLGNSVKEFFTNLEKGVSGCEPIEEFDTTLFKTKFACRIKDYSPEKFGFDRKEVRKYGKFSQYALIAAKEAIEDSNLDLASMNLSRVGVILGSGIGGIYELSQEIMGYVEGGKTPRYSPFLIPGVITNIAAGNISIKYGLKGPNYVVTSACASSLHAINDAYNMIQLGKADVMITGGTESPISEPGVGGFGSLMALSTRNDDYKTASRPFDKNRDGFVIGEGAGIIILEDYERAVARGAKIYAEITGVGITADAYHITAPQPDGTGASEAMFNAIQEAGLSTKDIDYINVHGTSTTIGDIAELNAIKNVFGEDAYDINISSTKSMTGHLLGAAGAIETIACIFAINRSIIPPTINFSEEDENIDYKLNLTLNKAQHREVNHALNNSFGFGGHNCSIVLSKLK